MTAVDRAAGSVEALNGVSKAGEHSLWVIVFCTAVNTPVAKWLGLLARVCRADLVGSGARALL